MSLEWEQTIVDARDPVGLGGWWREALDWVVVKAERLLGLGARRADVGQGEQSWVVLTDPEGNEFCVLGSREH